MGEEPKDSLSHLAGRQLAGVDDPVSEARALQLLGFTEGLAQDLADCCLVFPDDASAGAGSVYLVDPVRLEQLVVG